MILARLMSSHIRAIGKSSGIEIESSPSFITYLPRHVSDIANLSSILDLCTDEPYK